MSPHFLGLLFQLDLNRVFIFFHQSLLHILRNKTVRIQILVIGSHIRGNLCRFQSISRNRIFISKSFGSRQLVHPAIRTRRYHVMLNLDSLPVFRANQRDRVIPILEIFHLFPGLVFQILGSRNGLRVHTYQVIHLIPPVNIQ